MIELKTGMARTKSSAQVRSYRLLMKEFDDLRRVSGCYLGPDHRLFVGSSGGATAQLHGFVFIVPKFLRLADADVQPTMPDSSEILCSDPSTA